MAQLLAGYFELDLDTLILDVPEAEDDLAHARLALELAEGLLPAG